MPSAQHAYERWRRLTAPLTPFPLRCGHCAQFMTDDQELSVMETPGFGVGARVVHSHCYKSARREVRT